MKLMHSHIALKIRIVPVELCYVLLFIMYIPYFITRIVDIPHFGTISGFIILFSDMYFIMNKRDITVPTIWTSVLYCYFAFITFVVNTEETFNSLYRAFLAISFVLTIEYMLKKYSLKHVVRILLISMEVFNYINLLCMIIFPAGLYRVVTQGVVEKLVKVEWGEVHRTEARVIWLLGHQSILARFTLPAICIALLYILLNPDEKGVKWRSLFLIAVCLMETILANSAGNIILLLLFATLLLLFRFRMRIKTGLVYPIIAAVYVFFLTQFRELEVFSLMSNILNRKVELSSRVSIWLNTLKAWMERPIFGWGYINEYSVKIRQMISLGHPHSSYLWALFEGGIVGIILLVFWLQIFAKRMRGCWSSKCAKIIYAAFICTLIGMIDDDYIFRFPQMLLLFELVYHIPTFAGQEQR